MKNNASRFVTHMAAILTGFTLASHAATPTDFGYQHMLSSSSRPLLLIIAKFDGGSNLVQSAAYYGELIFNPYHQPRSVNGFLDEVSAHRFQWWRAGVVELSFRQTERSDTIGSDYLHASNIVYRAMTSGRFDFQRYDVNQDNHVTEDELSIAVFSDDGSGPGRRGGAEVKPDGSSLDVRQMLTLLGNDNTSFGNICHELCHGLGASDAYGEWGQEELSKYLTIMSSNDGGVIYHLDPWHKMQLGWSEPRIFSLANAGVATIPAAQAADAKAPVILYDPSRGTEEFFIIEYRTQSSPYGSNYDAYVSGNGLAIWRVKQDSQHNLVLVPRYDAGPLPAQTLWRFCNKCRGLHFIANANAPNYDPCPQGGNHVATNGGSYQVVVNNASAPGEHGWRWCQKCQGMFSGPSESISRCPAGGRHDGSASGDYSIVVNDPNTPGQQGWRSCEKCQGMFSPTSGCGGFGTGGLGGVCPAGGAHEGCFSGNYSMLLEGQNYVMWAEGPPDFRRGSSALWTSGATTPYLRWLDGTPTCTRIYVHPFNSGDGSITVEWLAEACTWVDFAYFGFFEFGTFDLPFNTLAEGINAVSWGGTLKIKSGSSAETAHIAKPMTIQAYGGPVTIGR